MSLQMMKRSMSRMLKQSIIDLCRNSVGAEGYVEIDGIVCITIGEEDTEEIVVKVHEIIGDEEEPDHFPMPHNLPPVSRASQRNIQTPPGRPRMPTGVNVQHPQPGIKQGYPTSSAKHHTPGHHAPLYTQAGGRKSPSSGHSQHGPDTFRRQASTPNRNQQDQKKQQRQTHDGTVIKIEIDSDDDSSAEVTPPGKKGESHLPNVACSVCDQSLPSVKVLKQHVKEVHDAVVCDICWQPFSTQVELNKHMKIHDKGQTQQRAERHASSPRNDGKGDRKDLGERFKCGVCGNTSDARQTMVDHLRTGHEFQGCYTCMLCREYFPNKPTFTIHRKLSHPTAQDIQCQTCGVGLLQKELENHRKECVSEDGAAPQKGKTRVNDGAGTPTAKRQRTESTPRPGPKNLNKSNFECPICKNQFNAFPAYERHMTSTHNRLLCSICAATLKNSRAVQQHMRRHTNSLPFKCDKCDLGNQSHLELRRHMVVAHDHHPAYFTCPQCNVFHETRAEFASHMKEVHKVEYIDEDELENYVVFDDEDEYNEEDDEEEFEDDYEQNSNFNPGQPYPGEDHGGYDDEEDGMDEDGEYDGMGGAEQLVTCNICELAIPTLDLLKEHINTVHHAVACEVCWRPFLTQEELDTHMKTHNQDKQGQTKDAGNKKNSSAKNATVASSAASSTGTTTKVTSTPSTSSAPKTATTFKCGVCGSASDGRKGMVEHLTSAHEYLGCFTCLLCGEFFPNKPTFTIHRKLSHSSANQVTCNSCGVGLHEHEYEHHIKECEGSGIDIKEAEWDTKKEIKQEKNND